MDPSFHVPAFFTWVAKSMRRHKRFWIGLGKLESAVLAPDLVGVVVREPVYVCGLARSGSTLLLEILAAQGDAASHRYQDFPFVFTPFWWQAVLKFSPFKDTSLRERAHGDGMLVNAASPEAMEEMLWNAFFPHNHDAGVSQVLGRGDDVGGFAVFYRKHIQKLLLGMKRKRYVSKGNYNVTRMAYLQSVFADARFVVPVREPVAHIASLMRQHARFCEAGKKDAKVALHMSLAGHYEFGLNRVAIHTGNQALMDGVLAAWKAGDELGGWALYWAMLYGFVAEQLEGDAALRDAAMVVRFEDLCAQPEAVLQRLFAHCRMVADEAMIGLYVAKIHKPDYYDAGFSAGDVARIRELTQGVARRFGY